MLLFQISALNEEKRQWGEQVVALERRCAAAEDESRRYREENARLKEELKRKEGSEGQPSKRMKPE